MKPTVNAKIGFETKMKTIYEEIVNPEDPDGPKLRRPKRISVTVVRCKLVCEYKTYERRARRATGGEGERSET